MNTKLNKYSFSAQNWLSGSFILNAAEIISLVQMTESSNGILLYRATRDGFEASAFHAKCDGKANTVTIIKTNGDYVFGGYTAADWDYYLGLTPITWNYSEYDSSAFLFSLRRNSVSNNFKFMVIHPQHAIYSLPSFGPIFGRGYDIKIVDKSNINTGSNTNFCHSYQCPSGYSYGDTSNAFLAGTYDGWLTSEIEVYQIQ